MPNHKDLITGKNLSFRVLTAVLLLIVLSANLYAQEQKQANSNKSSTSGNSSALTKEQPSTSPDGKSVTSKVATEKAVILNSPAPSYTRQARRNKTTGIVKVKAILLSTGEIEIIGIVEGLSDNLNKEAIKATKKIKFKPAMKNGVAVSQYVVFIYTFSL